MIFRQQTFKSTILLQLVVSHSPHEDVATNNFSPVDDQSLFSQLTVWILRLYSRIGGISEWSTDTIKNYWTLLLRTWYSLLGRELQSKYFIFHFFSSNQLFMHSLPFLQCVQSTGVLEVGYIEKIECDHETKDVVTFRRNLTIGIGCVCKPFGFQKLHLKNNPPYQRNQQN